MTREDTMLLLLCTFSRRRRFVDMYIAYIGFRVLDVLRNARADISSPEKKKLSRDSPPPLFIPTESKQ